MKKIRILMLMISTILLFVACGDSKNESTSNDIDLPEYEIALIDDANIGKVVRETIHIVVEGDYTLDQLNAIAEKEALAYTEKNKINALAIGFYEEEKNIGKGYDMGRVEYVPNGSWSEAMNVNAGDYSTFEFVNNLHESWNIKDPSILPIAEDEGETDLDIVRSDVENVYDGGEAQVSMQGDTLVIEVIESHEAAWSADEFTIHGYTEICLENIKSDVASIDITVVTSDGTVRAVLDTDKVEIGMGRYFPIQYVMDNMR